MRSLFFFLALTLSICADEFALAVTENDPSTLVEGVSVITGDLYAFEEDYVVQGAEPIHIRRSFLSREGMFKSYPHLTACFRCYSNQIVVNEPNGTEIYYYADPKNTVYPAIGENFFGEKKKQRKILRYNAFTRNDRGIANTKTGELSAHTNLKNQYILFDPAKDRKGKSFTLYASDGTTRQYTNFTGQEKVDSPYGAHYLAYYYKLVSETLPDGHMIHYRRDKKNRIDRIYTTNISQTKVFTSLNVPLFDEKDPPSSTTLNGSDHCSITYKTHLTKVKNLYVMNTIISPHLPDQGLSWEMKKRWAGGDEVKVPYLSRYSLPKSRLLKIDYDDSYDHRVKTLSAPVGKDANLVVTHSFFYDPNHKNSHVLDSQNNKTAYFWNDDYRLTRIDRYVGSNQIHSSDLFLWNKTNLKCKTFLNKFSNPVFARVYVYDDWGNVKYETFYGNLSGKSIPLKIDSQGLPLENGVESFTREQIYSQDGRNLLLKQLESNRLSIQYTYRNDSHLLNSKSICEENVVRILHTYDYDGDLIFTGETIKDDLSQIVKKITPCKREPWIGMPETIEEFDGDNHLLSKMVLHYGAGATIQQKDIYDSTGKKRYSLTMSYDDKNRLTSETNAIGQVAIYRYDEVGNLVYTKDFSGRLETFYEYDFSNRLIQRQEKGDDKIHRIYRYEYDLKHNLIAEIDPYTHETKYVPDPFGSRKEVHLPSIPNEKGELIPSAVMYKYDSAGNQIEKQDAEGNLTLTSYNAYGKPILITHPDGATEEFTYYPDSNLKTHTDPKKVLTSYTYDYMQRVVSKKRSNAEETFEYTGQYLTKKTDAEGNETLYTYDRAGRKIGEECSGEKITYTYDEFGRLRTTQKGDLVSITEYDLLGRIIEERNESPSQEVFTKVQYEYDAAGNRKAIIRSIDGKESKETLTYDSIGRLIERKDPLGSIETYEYDSQKHQKIHTDPLGLKTIETYNAQTQLASIQKEKNGKTLALTQKYYNKNGKLSLQIDTIYTPNGEQKQIRTRWEYNTRGLLQTLIEAEGTLDAKITQYAYTPLGELETLTKPDGVHLTYLYNDYGHLESLHSSDGTVKHQMKYNLLGHLQQSDDLIRTSDPFGRILKERFPHWHTIENTYDTTGRRTTCQIPAAGCLITYEYDPFHLKKVIRKKLDHTPLYSHTYTSHDLSGNVLEEELIENTGTIKSSFDLLNRKKTIQSPPFSQEVLTYDQVGNILTMRIDLDQIHYTYDDLYQLTSESSLFDHVYAFDSLNNRLQKDRELYEINPLNQISSHFHYDLNGNPIQYNNTTYTYDALDRLIRIENPTFIHTFTYDALHRCLSKTVIQDTTSTTVYFLYDGQNEIGIFDESLTPIELRILGNTPHAEIGAAVAIELNHKIHIPIHDLQGNLAALQPLGAQPTLYRYSAFGEEIIFGQAITSWRFSSKRTDNQTHLVYFGRRYYIPSFGRWLTPDPLGFTDGMNLYAYLHNSPLTHFDEYGLFEAPPWDCSSYITWKRLRWNHSPPILFKSGPYSLNTYNSPIRYVNGILNTYSDTIRGATTLSRTFAGKANVHPLHSQSKGPLKDLFSIYRARNRPNYTSFAVRRLNRELQWDIHCLTAMNDPRKLFVNCFSRGATDTYHACKHFSKEQRDRLIITACGPIMTLPRNLGFRVMNLISKGDWCSLYFHKGIIQNPWKYEAFADIFLLTQKDGFSGFVRDHFYKSRTYQEGTKDFTEPLYKKFGVLK